ncbi:MAG: hypothetical protein ABI852_02585 [Gemmatimonadaceae bacterium]
MRFPLLLVSMPVLAVSFAFGVSTRGENSAEPTMAHAVQQQVSNDPITRLQAQMDAGTVSLVHDTLNGYLRSVLSALKVPVSSQGLVFSRTSLQTELIATWAPRALYFNDEVYVGFVQGSEFLEIATVSPTEGAVFYTLDQELKEKPSFKRNNTCLSCHRSRSTTGVPGFMVLSSIVDKSGYFLSAVHEGPTVDATPVRNRFGGWYVTGTIGSGTHSGNVFSPKTFSDFDDRADARKQLDFVVESQRTNLNGKVELDPYIAPHSDIVALMVLVHETSVHNSMTVVRDAAVKALREDSAVSRYLKDTTFAQTKIVTSTRLLSAVERLVRDMLFIGAAPIDGPMKGTSNYAAEFAQLGPRDSKGRSLRDFDLQTRLFKYPLSFLIYSRGFDELPEIARKAVYKRLYEILSGQERGDEFGQLPDAERKVLLEILTETKPEFAASVFAR